MPVPDPSPTPPPPRRRLTQAAARVLGRGKEADKTTNGEVKLVALDLDGTLLNARKQVSRRTIEVLTCAREKGVRLVLASARPPRSVKAIYQKLKLDTWQINYNGALVFDPADYRPVWHAPMSPSACYEMIRLGREIVPDVQIACEILVEGPHVRPHPHGDPSAPGQLSRSAADAFDGALDNVLEAAWQETGEADARRTKVDARFDRVVDRWYTDFHDASHTTETGRMFKPDVIAPVELWCTRPVTKLMFLAEPKRVAAIREALREQYPHLVAVLHSDPDLLQVMSVDAGKGQALRRVVEHYGLSADQVLAIGDARNDVDMLEYAGIGVAMGNAIDAVKQIADWVAPNHNDHGVAAAIERFVL